MLGFFKRRAGEEDDGLRGSGFIQGFPGGITIVNLDRGWWAAELGLGDHRLVIPNAGGREAHALEDHEEGLRGGFLRLGKESGESRLLSAALERRTPVVVLYPALARIRNMTSELFEEFVHRRFGRESRDFDTLKLYIAPIRPGKTRFVRKFRGRGDQVVFNLSGEGINYFHLNTTDRDVTIDALTDNWPVGDDATSERLSAVTEAAVRSMDPAYFRRLRGGIEDGILMMLLPERTAERRIVLQSAGRLLLRAPGGGVDLSDSRVLRLHRTNRAASAAE
ncbi:MAG: hypothetical protein VX672_05760 [Planctomycetota bacterium]|nr:hypothetical protein [Planctomycetota bacterium]